MALKWLCEESNGRLNVKFYSKTKLTDYLDIRRICYLMVHHIDEFRKKFLIDVSPITVVFRSNLADGALEKMFLFSKNLLGCVDCKHFSRKKQVISIFLDSVIVKVLGLNLKNSEEIIKQRDKIRGLLLSSKIVERIAVLAKDVFIHESAHLLHSISSPKIGFEVELKRVENEKVSGEKLFKEIESSLAPWVLPANVGTGLRSVCYLYSNLSQVFISVLVEGVAMVLEKYYVVDVNEDLLLETNRVLFEKFKKSFMSFNSFLVDFAKIHKEVVILLAEKAAHDEVCPQDSFYREKDFESLVSYFWKVDSFIDSFLKGIDEYVIGEFIVRFILFFSSCSYKSLVKMDVDMFYKEYERIALSKNVKPILGFSNEALLCLPFVKEKLKVLLDFPDLLKREYRKKRAEYSKSILV